MGKATFKNDYIGLYGDKVLDNFDEVLYFSPLGRGDGTRENPADSKILNTNSKLLNAYIFSGGYHTMTASLLNNPAPLSGRYTERSFFGMGMNKTHLTLDLTTSGAGYFPSNALARVYYRDMKIQVKRSVNAGGWAPLTIFRNCDISGLDLATLSDSGVSGCKLRYFWFGQYTISGSNSWIGCQGTVSSVAKSNSLFDKCNVAVIQGSLDNYGNYIAFNDCNFRIGSETDFIPLKPKDNEGNEIVNPSESQLRAEFIRRCQVQGLSARSVTEYGQTNVAQGRWVFTQNCCSDGTVIHDSELHKWETLRNLAFGWTSVRPKRIDITQQTNIPASFAPQSANRDVNISNNNISFPSHFDITDKHKGNAYSKIIYLGGKKQLTWLDIAHNFPLEYGMMLDSADILSANPVTQIEAGETYLVRSTDKQPAEIVYNGITYTTSLADRKNVFVGVAGQTTFSGTANKAVYKVLDLVMQQSIQMRIVNTLPSDIIKGGNLQAGYWYFVEPDNSEDITGTVTYNGVVYSAYDSFLVDSVLQFTCTGNMHLRRCWRQNYDNPTDEVTDAVHWKFEQKPKWFDVLSEDLRCLKRYNSELEAEMMKDTDNENSNFSYYTSGHPDFYRKLLDDKAFRTPAYNIAGTYMQLCISISTLNPM